MSLTGTAGFGGGDCASDSSVSALTEEWYAGAEIELVERHGMDVRDAVAFSGIGKVGIAIHHDCDRRFRNVACDFGLAGQRMCWAAKALWTCISAMCSQIGSPARGGFLDLALPMSARARAFRHEILHRPGFASSVEHSDVLLSALRLLGRAGLQTRGIPPLITRLRHCNYDDTLDTFKSTQEVRPRCTNVGAQCSG